MLSWIVRIVIGLAVFVLILLWETKKANGQEMTKAFTGLLAVCLFVGLYFGLGTGKSLLKAIAIAAVVFFVGGVAEFLALEGIKNKLPAKNEDEAYGSAGILVGFVNAAACGVFAAMTAAHLINL